ncbi:peptidoglycan-binding domain-containing protein [Streptomyces sp. CC219B]|uniref:peptidoglycan-binding protein n=1 Tax=Streptomyces sp. CC219B TaxID=3044574 RepID=UPI0024A94BFF|nr:peptidoglycan-binding domain-containing protein [Streptomyces sp. CC219B]
MENNGPPLEPIRVLRPRRTDALAELLREPDRDGGYKSVPVAVPPRGSEDETQELPPVREEPSPAPGRPLPRAAVAVAMTIAALAGFGFALLLPGDPDDRAAPPPAATASGPSAPASTAPAPAAPAETGADPDGPGTLREGDSGPDVTDLQERLLRVPDVYTGGSTSGRYDGTLTAAVARFQLWYGIRGDETGVYGDDTRLALESRTTAGDG